MIIVWGMKILLTFLGDPHKIGLRLYKSKLDYI